MAQTGAVPAGSMYEEVGREGTSTFLSPDPTDTMIYDANYYIVHPSATRDAKATPTPEQQENVYQSISQSQAEAARKEESHYVSASPPVPSGDNEPISEGEYLKVIGQVENVAISERAAVPESTGYLELVPNKERTSPSPVMFHSEELLIDPKIYANVT